MSWGRELQADGGSGSTPNGHTAWVPTLLGSSRCICALFSLTALQEVAWSKLVPLRAGLG